MKQNTNFQNAYTNLIFPKYQNATMQYSWKKICLSRSVKTFYVNIISFLGRWPEKKMLRKFNS